jgi:hypothetical protein
LIEGENLLTIQNLQFQFYDDADGQSMSIEMEADTELDGFPTTYLSILSIEEQRKLLQYLQSRLG